MGTARPPTSEPSPIVLAPVRPDDAAPLLAWIPDASFLLQWAGPQFEAPVDEARLVEHWRSAAAETPARRCYRVTRRGDDALVGYGELGAIDLHHRSARLSRLLIGPPEARGRGLGRALVDALLGVAFEELSLHRVELGVYEQNRAAIRCYESAGFRIEGVRRESERAGDAWWSSCVMAVLEHEWRRGS